MAVKIEKCSMVYWERKLSLSTLKKIILILLSFFDKSYLMKKVIITIICVLLFNPPCEAGEDYGKVFTKADYNQAMHNALERIIKRSKPKPHHKLLFAANLFYKN
jgi:hypothetical protein